MRAEVVHTGVRDRRGRHPAVVLPYPMAAPREANLGQLRAALRDSQEREARAVEVMNDAMAERATDWGGSQLRRATREGPEAFNLKAEPDRCWDF